MEDIITIFAMVKPIHYLLAYAGMLIHILTKAAEMQRKDANFSFKDYLIKNSITIATTLISIPILLIAASDNFLKELLPINNLTAILAGWQTQSLLKSIMGIYQRKQNIPSSDSDSKD